MIKQKSKSLADQVFEQLEAEILSGQIRLGSYMTELDLAARLGVSRTPVREALRRLEQEHMVEETSKGMHVIGITAEEAEQIYEIRERIESLAAVHAAHSATDEQLEHLRDIIELQEFYLQRSDAEKLRKLDNDFHETLYQASGSRILYDTLSTLHHKVMKYRKLSVQDPNRAPVSTAEHRAIYEALLAKDARTAAEATKRHVINAHKSIVRLKKQ